MKEHLAQIPQEKGNVVGHFGDDFQETDLPGDVPRHHKIDRLSVFLGLCASLCTVIGTFLYTTEKLYVPDTAPWLYIILVPWTIGLAVLYAALIARLVNGLASLSGRDGEAPALRVSPPPLRVIVRALGLLLCWLPLLLLSLPGTVHGDYIVQLLQHFGNRPLDTANPFVSTLIYGCLYDAGYALLGSSSGGILFTVITQAVLFATSISICLTAFESLGTNVNLVWAAWAFFACTPIFPLYAFDCVKDTLACPFVIIYVTLLCSCYHVHRTGMPESWWHSTPLIVIVGIVCSFLRNNFSYCVIPSLLVLQLSRRNLRSALLSTACVVVTTSLFGTLVVNVFGVEKGNIREVLSVPMQQVAYCLTNHGDDITKEERKNIQSLLTVDIDEIPSCYTFRISDPVKSRFNIQTRDELALFMRTWASIGLRHPRSYLTAFLHGNFGYWYPYLRLSDIKWSNPLSISPEDYIAQLHDTLKMDFSGDASHLLEVKALDRKTRDSVRELVEVIGNTPVIGLLFEPALFIWIALFVGSHLARGRGNFAPLVFCGMLFLTCCASPDFSNVRYAFPFFSIAPLLVLCYAMPTNALELEHPEDPNLANPNEQ